MKKTRKEFDAWIVKNKIKVNFTIPETLFLNHLVRNQNYLTQKGDITGVFALFYSFVKNQK